MLTLGITAAAQQTTPSSAAPTVQNQLRVLTEKLDLTRDQQTKIKPILDQLHEAAVKIMQDDSLSREERLAKARPWFYQTDRKIREVLNDDQKKKLDRYEQGPHPEMHGDLAGPEPAPRTPGI